MNTRNDFQGVNLGYVLELYEKYLTDPKSVDLDTRAFFEHWTPPEEARPSSEAVPAGQIDKIVGTVNLAESIRKFGHMDARLDPLGSEPRGDYSLLPQSHGISEDDLRYLPASLIVGPIAVGKGSAFEVIKALREVYSSSTGYDYGHLRNPEERHWLHEAAESRRFRDPNDPVDLEALLDRLTQVETFEHFLHRTFPGKTRFSVEGLDMLIPILDELVCGAGESNVHNVLIGMAHRARLNVLAHILQKPYAEILAIFRDPVQARNFREDLGWTGDVKYHLGAQRAVKGGQEVGLVITMSPNPSHLEAVNPVVEGMARAAGTVVDRKGPPQFDSTRTLPVLIHGDAAFSGQGVVAETLNFYRLPGYNTGGTIHIIADNQLGYTTTMEDYRSSYYASGLARGFKIPLVHVNADDPLACIEVARLAFAYRAKFGKDFVIDLVGYRRFGHNEGDEPGFTQPLLYEKIATTPTVRERWAVALVKRGVVSEGRPEELVHHYMEKLQQVLESLKPTEELTGEPPEPPPPGAALHAKTSVPFDTLQELNKGLLQLPEGFNVHRKLERARSRRAKILDDPDAKTIDWATAEELALASVLADGTAIRVTGEDVERGTFSQRHAVLHDVKTGQKHIPLQALAQAQAAFEIHNSPLTENAVVGFEYGYSLQEPSRLVIWEAQYGDFINGAQVMIDEFLISARAKWGLTPSLVMLLPHGFEGQGPDHSSGRPERFLQLAAGTNLRVANCTTAAQYFHLLRRQASLLKVDPLPLIILTPKSLLRHPLVASSPRELAEGSWHAVIDDADAGGRLDEIRRLVLCSGKVYVDLVTSEYREKRADIAICRIEQLYPFRVNEVRQVLERYPKLQEAVWVQEEPENMGAWEFVRPMLSELVRNRWALRYIGRSRSSSPAEGSTARHAVNQDAIVKKAFSIQLAEQEEDMVLVENIAEGSGRNDRADQNRRARIG
ncbi:MAG: 2-oxoglutarate dehydrogenase E1 component [Acidobacteria bacterium]|nr:MAG: 2-oxoglutarate dehydrogenase E1 component [Acidobacteriota bacterium]